MTQTLLVEIGTEELPPKALRELSEAFAAGLRAGLQGARLTHGDMRCFATPRRLAVRIEGLTERQPDTELEKLGPTLSAAYDQEGKPTPAALGFARGCGLDDPTQLESVESDRGPRLCFRSVQPGVDTVALLPGLITKSLQELPIPRRMRWGASRVEFVRPVHWVLLLLGDRVIEADMLGVRSGRYTRGHRVHAPEEFALTSPEAYEEALEKAFVVADFETRRQRIRAGVEALAERAGGVALIAPELLDEVTALNEWPMPLLGRFDEHFLEVPREALISSMQGHQKYFPVAAAHDGSALLPRFITVANIDSREPAQVVAGNERVIRPRFADAAFFYHSDRKTSLAQQRPALRAIVYQRQLGSLFDKTERVAKLTERLAPMVGADAATAVRAAELAKSDLVTAMVQEFGELQGVMGRYYATHDGEPSAVAEALFEQYLPRHAGDALPASATGIALALGDRIDTLAGIFSVGQEPTGSRDPFGLRRAAIAVLRILIERNLDIDLLALLEHAAAQQPGCEEPNAVARRVFDYVIARLRALGEEEGLATESFLAVVELGIHSPRDLWRRMAALHSFITHPSAASLIATDKRIANLLQRTEAPTAIDTQHLRATAEVALWDCLQTTDARVRDQVDDRNYPAALEALSALQAPVDRFFEEVLVMVDEPALRNNRLALLGALRRTFSTIADLSRLAARIGAR